MYKQRSARTSGVLPPEKPPPRPSPTPTPTPLPTVVTIEELVDASNGRDIDRVKQLMRADPEVVSRCDNQGRTVLHHACGKGNLQVVDHILSAILPTTPSLLHQKDGYGETPLHRAARFNHSTISRLLLRHGASLATRDLHGNSPLHVAAHTGKAEMVELLVGLGADVVVQNNVGATPLDVAKVSTFSNKKVVGLLQVASQKVRQMVHSPVAHPTTTHIRPTVRGSETPAQVTEEIFGFRGHYVRSKGEALLDDWLYFHRVWHSYEHQFILPTSPTTLLTPDFYLPDYDVYIELWGFAEDDPIGKTYTARRREKEEMYRKFDAPVIGIGQEDLKCLDDFMGRKLAEWRARKTEGQKSANKPVGRGE
ncbi:ankyrin repeat-containing domain protein [Endogone sp. FLAS-F59071]|nr:ankyrin repeat-containing domain protein [Endogone sp. FLAS-F59071]|eukprot:RUS15954.1 ankyrin repeat-containing domain protein [Endogone sp. FLAS-F59071]